MFSKGAWQREKEAQVREKGSKGRNDKIEIKERNIRKGN
jgi:hypothetical protein